jgi:hypothetical protein
MATMKKFGWGVAALMIAFAIGCGEGGSGGSKITPNETQQAQAQVADAGSAGTEVSMDAANDALVEAGAPGSTTAKTGATTLSTGGTSIDYHASVTLTVDLDMLNGSGQDKYPNASGKFTVAANGSIVGDAFAGEITYDVTVTWITDGTFTDPVCEKSLTVNSGSHWSYSLKIVWTKVDELNWSIQADAQVDHAVSGVVTKGPKSWTVSGTLTRHASVSFTRVAGAYTFSWGINGERTVIVSDGVETHTVVFTMSALDHVVVTVDGVAFGPYTAAQVWWFFHLDCKA